MFRGACLLVAVLAVLADSAAPARAAFPGREGRLLVALSSDQRVPAGPNASAVSMRPDGSARRLIGRGEDADWSSSGRQLLFTRGGRVWTARSDGRHRRRFRAARVRRYSNGPFDVRWARDSRWLYFVRSGTGEEPRTALYRARVDGSREERILANAPNRNGPFAVAPDGRTLFVIRRRPGRAELWAIPARGGAGRQVVELPGAIRPAQIDVSPDGGAIILDGAQDGSLAVIGADGTGLRALGARGYAPVWSPTGDHIAFLRSTTPANSEPVVANADGSDQRVVVSGNAASVSWQPKR